MNRTITRRQALAGLGSVGLGALLAACGGREIGGGSTTAAEVSTTTGASATVQPQTESDSSLVDLFDAAGTCTATPEQTEGPYYFDVDAIRTDIREDRPGARLRLAVRVQKAAECTPLENAVVEIWHCDAGGIYSGYELASTGGGGGGGPTDEETYLRGAQVTNADGIAEFVTIYPGWYRGRTVHIHTKVHLDSSSALTTQLYFDEAVTEQVYASSPYTGHAGRDTFNDGDSVIETGVGTPAVLTLSEEDDGYLGLITIGVATV